ncbi:MAG: carboxypeptidase regulatory-like domain-containing protein [Pyrinomonadaceae bacterium]
MALQREREARKELEQVLKREQVAKSEVQESLDRETIAKGEAVRQRSIAEEQREKADNLSQIALSREIAANALSRLPANPELSVLLATEALRLSETSEAKDSLRQALLGYRLTTTFRSHKSPVRLVEYSPDGKSIVSVSDDKAVVWDAATKDILFELKGENGRVNSAAFSPDSKRIITVAEDGTARLWNATTGLSILLLQGHRQSVVSGTFSPDSKLVVTASLDNTQRVWEVGSGRCIFVLSTPVPAVSVPSSQPKPTATTGSIEGTVTDPNGVAVRRATVTVTSPNLISPQSATTDDNGRFQILNLPPGLYKVSIEGTGFSKFEKENVAVNLGTSSTADASLSLATATATVTVTGGAGVDTAQSTTASNVSIEQFSNFPTQRTVQSLYAIAPTVTRSGLGDATGRAANTNDVLNEEKEPLEKEVAPTTARFSADGKLILAQDMNAKATLWSVETGQIVHVLKGYRWVRSPVLTPDGKYIVASVSPDGRTSRGETGVLSVWNASNGESIFEISDYSDPGFEPTVSPDGKYIVAGGNNNIVVLRDIETRVDTLLQGHGSPIQSATFSPNGNYLATTDASNTVRVWDIISGRGLFILQGHTNTILKAAFSPDSRSIVTAGGDHTVKLWNINDDLKSVRLSDVEGVGGDHGVFSSNAESVAVSARGASVTRVYETATGKLSFELEGKVRSNLQPAFSRDGNYLVHTGDNNAPQVTNAKTGTRMFFLRGHTAEVLSAAFSADSQSIVTASDDKTARVWDATNGQNTIALTGHRNKVNSAEFSSDGARVVTASNDNTARLWDRSTGKQLMVFVHVHNVSSATFSPNGKFIVTVDEVGWTQVWNVLTYQHSSMPGLSFPDSGAILSPDGLSIATLGPQNTVLISSIATGNRLMVLEGHTDTVSSISFSPNSEVIVTTGEDHTMRIWNAKRGTQLGATEIDRDLDPAEKFSKEDRMTTAFSADSRLIVTLYKLTILQTYACEVCDSPNGLITSAQSRIMRRLDPREREIYLHLTESR